MAIPLQPFFPPPPRFANSESPVTPKDWMDLTRWLNSVYRVVSTSASVPLVVSLTPPPYRPPGNNSQAVAIYVTHTLRISSYPASSYPAGQILQESDTTYCYVGDGTNWNYQSGIVLDSSSTLTGVPNWLGVHDAGALYRNSNFQRLWMWDGTIWHYADGGFGAGAQCSTVGSTPPSGGAWGLCDGSSYACALDDATISSVGTSNTAPDIHGNNPAIMGGVGGSQQLATPAQWDPAAITDDESAHTHNVTINATATATGTAIGTTLAQGQTVTSATGTAHHHSLSDGNAILKAPSDADGSMSLRVSMKWWVRL